MAKRRDLRPDLLYEVCDRFLKREKVHRPIPLLAKRQMRADTREALDQIGINIPRLAVDVTEAEWDKIMAIDLKGVFFATQAAAKKAFIPQGSGKVVNIASQMGVVGYMYRSAYCSAKAGVVNLTRVLAFEWAKLKINVNTIAPTFLDTPLTRPMFENKEFFNDVMSRIPMGRLATPEDIVGAAVYLSSPAADMVTGHTLLVDGGWTTV